MTRNPFRPPLSGLQISVHGLSLPDTCVISSLEDEIYRRWPGLCSAAVQHHERLHAVAVVYHASGGKWVWTHLGRNSAKPSPELPSIVSSLPQTVRTGDFDIYSPPAPRSPRDGSSRNACGPVGGSGFRARQSRAPQVVPPTSARGSAHTNPELDRLRAGLFLPGTADQIFAAPRMRPGEPSGPTTCRRMAHLRSGWAERTDKGSFSSTRLPIHMPTVSMSRTLWR